MHIQTSDQPSLELGFGGYRCNWGVHICGLFETEAERDEIIFGFLNQGDIDGDFQVLCTVEQSEAEFRARYAADFPDCAAHIDEPGRFVLSSPRSLYYPDGVFSPYRMDEGLNDLYRRSQKSGPRNIRATADMAWALEAVPGVEHLMVYESRLNYFIPPKPWISICLYNLNRFGGATIMDVLRTHPYAISSGVITENPFYQSPDDWLAQNAPAFLSH